MTENKVNKYVPKLLDSNKAYIKDMKKKNSFKQLSFKF